MTSVHGPLCHPLSPCLGSLMLGVFEAAILPWLSRSHLGSDLAQAFHPRWAVLLVPLVMGCSTGAQVRLMRPTHRTLSVTAPSAIKMHPAKEQQLHGN